MINPRHAFSRNCHCYPLMSLPVIWRPASLKDMPVNVCSVRVSWSTHYFLEKEDSLPFESVIYLQLVRAFASQWDRIIQPESLALKRDSLTSFIIFITQRFISISMLCHMEIPEPFRLAGTHQKVGYSGQIHTPWNLSWQDTFVL